MGVFYFGFLNIWYPSASVSFLNPASINSDISLIVVGVPSFTALLNHSVGAVAIAAVIALR